LNASIPKRAQVTDVVEAIRLRVKELVNQGMIIYIAIDQLEEAYRNAMNNPSLLGQLAEVLRGKLSAMVGKRYALGISMIDLLWKDFVSKWPSVSGIDTIWLRELNEYEIRNSSLDTLRKLETLS
jgi:hypothetical protein